MSEQIEEKLSDVERNFLVRRSVQASPGWVGVSSNAMVWSALTGEPATAWPFDGWDLGRCIVTRNVAPEHLHEAMDAYIAAAEPEVASAHHGLDAAKKMADEKTPEIAAMLAKPHWSDR